MVIEIKICGITSIQEIECLNVLKPEYVGFIFAESKRKITKEQGRLLYESLNKDIKTVGVFRDNSLFYIKEILQYIPLDIVQLHGNEDSNFIASLKIATNCEIWKAISFKSRDELIEKLEYPVDTLILDGSNPGSGEVFSWSLLNGVRYNKKIILAGGVNENNVLEGINKIKPQGIDVSSGVEIINEDGTRIKSKEKIEKLIRKVRDSYEGEI